MIYYVFRHFMMIDVDTYFHEKFEQKQKRKNKKNTSKTNNYINDIHNIIVYKYNVFLINDNM